MALGMNASNLVDNLPRMTAIQLINALDAAYPERCIGSRETPEAAHRYAGKREMILELKTLMDFHDAAED